MPASFPGSREPADAAERWRALAAASPSILWTAADDGRVVSGIPGWEAFTGQSFEQYRGFGWLGAVHPEDRRAAEERWKRPPREGVPVETRYRLQHRDGGYRRVEVRSLPLLAEDGGVREWTGAVTEVETLRSAEEALRASEQRFRRVVDSAADALFVHDLEGRFVFVNRRACESLGYSREELLQMRVEDVEMDLVPGALWRKWREMVPGDPVTVEGTQRRKDGTTFPVEVRVGLLETGGEPLLMALARDVTERRRAEQERDDLLRQLELEQSYLKALMQQMPIGVVVSDAGGRLRLFNEETERILGHSLLSAVDLESYAEHGSVHVDGRPYNAGEYPQARSHLSGEEVREEEMHYVRGDGVRTLLSVNSAPVRDRAGNVIATVATMQDISERREAEREREELLGREQRARAEAERARDRLDFLAEASRRLASSLDYESTLREVARLAVPRVAELCLVDVVCEGGAIRRLGAAHPDPAKEDLAWELERRYPVEESPESRIAAVIRTGEPLLIPEVTDLHLEDMAPDDGKLEILKKMDFSSLVIAPLVVRGRTLGAISLFAEGPGRCYGSDELSMVEDLGRRAAQAIDNARLHHRQSRTASALQRSLLPPRLPEVPGLETAARYRPAGEGNDVGGDFYDLFGTPVGWAVAIGDVVGKGPEAAELTALARYTVRTAAMQEQEPSRILSTLNAALLNQRSDGRFCTMTYGNLLPSGLPTGGARLDLCCGGHPLPLVLRAGGSVEEAGERGMLLGFYPDVLLRDRRVELAEGDVVLFYTDGVTETRGPGGELFGEERLAELLASCAGCAAEEVAGEIDGGLCRFAANAARSDDVAFLVLRVVGP